MITFRTSGACLLLNALLIPGLFAQAVPQTYQAMYNNLASQISAFESTVQAGWNHSSYPTLYAPQVQAASSDEFTQLLKPYYMTAIVLPEVEELQALGATGVTVHIDFPILYQPFYASNPSQYQEFVSFYQQLAIAVHSRGLKLVVESASGEPFPGDNAESFQTYLAGLSWTAYMSGRAQNAVNVAQLIEPDYMSVIDEPDTEASVTGQASAGTPSGSLQLLQTILTALKAGNVTNVQVGAGAGTWTVNYSEYLTNFSQTSVDFVDMHIYPVNGNDFLEALTAADTIHNAGKQVGMTEAWPWKVTDAELGRLSYVNISARDPFSFWAPIDTAFLQAIADFSQYKQLLFISPFWSDYFFSYLDYNTYQNDSPGTILPIATTAADSAVGIGAFTPTGHAWESMIIKAPDKTPPAVPAAPTASGIGTVGLNLAWLPTTDNVGPAAYQIYKNGSLYETTSQLIWYEKNLTPGATYTYNIAAFDASGNVSAKSPPLVVTTVNTTPPPPPTNLKVTGSTSRTVSLSWTASSDISGIAGYRILQGKSSGSLSIIKNLAAPATSYTVSVAPSTTYYYEVEAYIPNGITSGPGNEVTVTTPSN